FYGRYCGICGRGQHGRHGCGTISVRRPNRRRVAEPRRYLGVTMPGNTQLRRLRLAALAQRGAGDSPVNQLELAISDIRAHALREPVSRRTYAVLEVQTKGGLTGYASAPPPPRTPWRWPNRRRWASRRRPMK